MKTGKVLSGKTSINFLVSLLSLTAALNAFAAVNFEIDTPGVKAIKQKMQDRHAQLAGYYASGVIGLTSDGMVVLRDIRSIPQDGRYTIDALVAAENQDRFALYAEIARANRHPEWEEQIRNAFAKRWVQHARPGWWIQAEDGWDRK